MAPSDGKNLPSVTQIGLSDVNDTSFSTSTEVTQENQRPPVFNPEDYIISLKKYGCRGSNGNFKSIYDTTINEDVIKKCNAYENVRSQTLPYKNLEQRSPILTLPTIDAEMSLRQFASITDLLTKLRADLRASFPSFVQEFISSPLDGVSLLLEVLRAVQLSQSAPTNMSVIMPLDGLTRTNQSYQRRSLLDELACLQCLSICCTRSPEAGARLGTTPIGLLPLAAAATGTGIRSRILALQLLTIACDKSTFKDGTHRSLFHGHTAVSEALSTLRLRCAEPVRFRLLVGMLNSGGGSGELQAVGMKFINTFLESAENTQMRLYLQAELFQAGLDSSQVCKTIASSSPWLERLRNEIKRWDATHIDIEELQLQARSVEQVRSRLVILERRLQILHEEKIVLTTMERRLQERCSELQQEVLRLKGASNECSNLTNHGNASCSEKRPVALPRLVTSKEKLNGSSEHDDEGISSSETGHSLTPELSQLLSANDSCCMTTSIKSSVTMTQVSKVPNKNGIIEDDANASIEDVIEELQSIVNEAEREISDQTEKMVQNIDDIHRQTLYNLEVTTEKDIVPVNLLPHPPRKSRSLVHLISNPSDEEESGFDLHIASHEPEDDFFDEDEYTKPEKLISHDTSDDDNMLNNVIGVLIQNKAESPALNKTVLVPNLAINLSTAPETGVGVSFHHQSYACDSTQRDSNRAILNVIMDARDKETRRLYEHSLERSQQKAQPVAPQQFNGVFFMTDTNSSEKYRTEVPKRATTALLEAKDANKKLDRIGSCGFNSMVDIGMTNGQRLRKMNAEGAHNPAGGAISCKIIGNNNFKLRPNTESLKLTSCNTEPVVNWETSRSQTNINGLKVTDLPSGLY